VVGTVKGSTEKMGPKKKQKLTTRHKSCSIKEGIVGTIKGEARNLSTTRNKPPVKKHRGGMYYLPQRETDVPGPEKQPNWYLNEAEPSSPFRVKGAWPGRVVGTQMQRKGKTITPGERKKKDQTGT